MLNKQQIFIDASVLKESACHRKLFWTIREGYKPAGDQLRAEYKMGYGSAIHKFLEDYYKLLPAKAAVEKAKEYYEPYNEVVDITPWEFRTTNNVIKTCIAYAERFPRRKDGAGVIRMGVEDFQPLVDAQGFPMVEYKFAIPIWCNEFFDLILSGTIDLVCEYQGYPLVLVDHKTTSRRFDEAYKFFDEFEFNIQTMLYSKVYKETNGLTEYPPICINGIFCKKPTKKAEDAGIFDGVDILRSPVKFYEEDDIARFDKWFDNKIRMIVSYIVTGNEPEYEMAACAGSFGKPCKYYEVCKLPTIYQQGKLEAAYIREQYNPLAFRD